MMGRRQPVSLMELIPHLFQFLRRTVTPFLFVSLSASGVAGRPSPSASLILYVSLLIDFSEFRSCR